MPEDLLNENTALGMLRSEHRHIEDLLITCLTSTQVEFTRQATAALMRELEIHKALEHEMFFPAMQKMLSNRRALFGRSPEESLERARQDSSEIATLTDRLGRLDPAKAGYQRTLNDLTTLFERHCFLEEEYVFAAVEMNDDDTHNQLIELSRKMRQRRDSLSSSLQRSPHNVSASQEAKAETRKALFAGDEELEGGQGAAHGA